MQCISAFFAASAMIQKSLPPDPFCPCEPCGLDDCCLGYEVWAWVCCCGSEAEWCLCCDDDAEYWCFLLLVGEDRGAELEAELELEDGMAGWRWRMSQDMEMSVFSGCQGEF